MIHSNLILKGPKNSRLLNVEVRAKNFATPTYFPAVSTKTIRGGTDQFVELVTSSGYPRLLVSAYDYRKSRTDAKRPILRKLRDYSESGSILMIDSGVFEAYWREDPSWEFRRYEKSIRNIESDFFFSFDILPFNNATPDRFHRLTARSIRESAGLENGSNCIPIVHGNDSSRLINCVSAMARKMPDRFTSLAVSERELGRTISERCMTVTKIRKILDGCGHGLLHVLGCGQPLSMALYAYCGADMFDSLDWAISAFDNIEEKLTDISHFEFIGCKCEICRNSRIDLSSRVYLHNLLAYQKYVLKLHSMIKQGTLTDYLYEVTNKKFLAGLA